VAVASTNSAERSDDEAMTINADVPLVTAGEKDGGSSRAQDHEAHANFFCVFLRNLNNRVSEDLPDPRTLIIQFAHRRRKRWSVLEE
jgi:hypothetical protein